jgi:presenilin-like A22 family membrane protease
MPDSSAATIALAFGLAALCAWSVAVPQAILLVRLLRIGDDIALYTLKTVLWTSSLGIALGWRSLVFLDWACCDQGHLGNIDQRWGIEAAMALYIALAVFYAAALYHKTVTFGERA